MFLSPAPKDYMCEGPCYKWKLRKATLLLCRVYHRCPEPPAPHPHPVQIHSGSQATARLWEGLVSAWRGAPVPGRQDLESGQVKKAMNQGKSDLSEDQRQRNPRKTSSELQGEPVQKHRPLSVGFYSYSFQILHVLSSIRFRKTSHGISPDSFQKTITSVLSNTYSHKTVFRMSWGGGSAVKRPSFSFRGPQFDSQQPHGGSLPSAMG
ncbi:uncharacterized protein LOC134486643 [Rattus norvegicus]|uniref:uncharacterized protein LOC134486643 n=1 Tax=Rattus norvegicus TaxID=10116 RepID=UPI002FD7A76E